MIWLPFFTLLAAALLEGINIAVAEKTAARVGSMVMGLLFIFSALIVGHIGHLGVF